MEIWNDMNLQVAGVDYLYKYIIIDLYIYEWQSGVCTHECLSISRYGEHLCDTYKCENGNLYHSCSLRNCSSNRIISDQS